ncbi:MAG: aminopeptidase [Opitutae bacterium]|nr:aminopeptidase [Opitutae bacterium]
MKTKKPNETTGETTSSCAPVNGVVKREDAVNRLSTDERKALNDYVSAYTNYLGVAKTERRAYAEAVKILEARGFKLLADTKTLKPGDKVYRGYHGKTLFAAIIGEEPVSAGVRVVGGHTDAPRIDLKPVPLCEKNGIAYFDTHYYGGIKKFQWVALPLAIYGTAVRKDGTKVDIAIGDKPGDPVFMISDILPHFGQEQGAKTLNDAFPGENLDLIIATTPCPKDKDDDSVKEKVKLHVLRILAEEYKITEQDLVSAELEIVPAGTPREMGLDRSLITGYGHDDRICAFAGLKALADIEGTPAKTAVVLLCDKEEIGSVGATGMDSTFFENSIAELVFRQRKDYSDIVVRRALEASEMLSADVCAAHDPLFPNASSPGNMAIFNAGACMIKYTGARGKGGANDASAEFIARLREVFDAAGVVWQVGELGRVDAGGGGTIALFMSRYGMNVVDMGTPLLNMHAPWEIASKHDAYMTYKAYKAFFCAK